MTVPTGLAPATSPQPDAEPRGSAIRHIAAIVFTLAVAILALPDLFFGLDRHSPFLQLVAMRPWILCGIGALLVLLLVAFVFERRVWPFAAGLLAVLLIGGSLVLPRVLPDAGHARGSPFRVLAFNASDGRADANEFAALIKEEQPDAVAIDESGNGFADRLEPLIEPLGYHVNVLTDDDDDGQDEEVTAAVSEQFGDVDVKMGDATSTASYIEVTAGEQDPIRFVAFSSAEPVPDSLPEWNADLAMLSRWCAGSSPAVIAGDFNATLDHSALRAGTAGCDDAAAQRGDGLIPTWSPSPAMQEIGPQVDHVFATDGITAETFDVHDIKGSDHRAIVTTLRIGG